MKKVFIVTFAVIISFVLCLPISAARASISSTYGTPVIDGEIDDIWATTEVRDVKLVDKEVIPSESTTTGVVRTMWDEKYFYALVVVDKNGIAVYNGLVNENNDAVELGYTDSGIFDGLNNVSNDADITAGDFRVDANGVLSGFGGYYLACAADSSFKGAYKKIAEDQYLCEFAIPWKNATPTVGNKVSMEVQINDNAEGSGRTGLVTWASTPSFGWRDSAVHGEVVLAAAPVVEEVKTEITNENPITADSSTIAYILIVLSVIGGSLTFKKFNKQK